MNNILKPGNILLVKNYRLTSGEIKDKFMVVLAHRDNGEMAYLSLTTSKQYIQQEDIHPGCISKGLKNMYMFPAGNVISDNGFAFRKDTFILTIGNIITTSEDSFLVYIR